MQGNYIGINDISDLLPFRKFFGETLDIFKDPKIMDYLYGKREIMHNDSIIIVLRIDDEIKKYLKYVEYYNNYYVVSLGIIAKQEANWILDEKTNTLISFDSYCNIPAKPEFYVDETIKQIKKQYLEKNAPVVIKQDKIPVFDFRTDYLTARDKFEILKDLEIPRIINCSKDLYKLRTMFESIDGMYYGMEGIEDIDLSSMGPIIFTDFDKLPYLEQMKLLTFQVDNKNIILCGDASNLQLPDAVGIINFDDTQSDFYEVMLNRNTNYTKKNFCIGKMPDNIIHPALYIYFCGHLSNDIDRQKINYTKIFLASKILYVTNNPRAMEPILGKEITDDFMNMISKYNFILSRDKEEYINESYKSCPYIEECFMIYYLSKIGFTRKDIINRFSTAYGKTSQRYIELYDALQVLKDEEENREETTQNIRKLIK